MSSYIKFFLIGALLSLSNVSLADEEDFFYGKYLAVFDHWAGEVSFEFLLNSNDEILPLKINSFGGGWKEARSVETNVHRVESFASSSPFIDQFTIGFSYGTHEDGLASYVTLAWLGKEENLKLTVLSSMSLYKDGERRAFKDNVTLYSWNKSKNVYEKLENL
ncbi:MAG: hypothetical protein KBD78_04240 [Oligoflexales bacterium]|nr:hypothetical protein [Oligoflexales bacterium]